MCKGTVKHPSESFLQRVSLGKSVLGRRLGLAAFAVAAALSPLVAKRFIALATNDADRGFGAVVFVMCLLFFTWEIRLFTAGRPVAFYWLMPEATGRSTFARWINFCIDLTVICWLLYYLAAGSP